MQGGEIGHGAKEPVGWRWRFMWDGRRLVDISAEESRLRLLLDQHGHLVVSTSPVQLVPPLQTTSSWKGGSAGCVILDDPRQWVARPVARSLAPRLRFRPLLARPGLEETRALREYESM